ncbi:MAG: DUF370 domain-containing protein [Chloroflexota bacterium]|nr:DUF370 domain-containing protein [Chloroflexota bacterium]
MIKVGFENYVPPERVAAVGQPGSKPLTRMTRRAKERDMLIDFTAGRRTKGVVILDSGQLVLSALTPETLAGRYDKEMERRAVGRMQEG